jgi:hypothetical protein
MWVESVPVHETGHGETVRAGEVQVFDLVKHPKAARADAWSHAPTGTRRQFHVALHLPPVDGPVMAVKPAVYGGVSAPPESNELAASIARLAHSETPTPAALAARSIPRCSASVKRTDRCVAFRSFLHLAMRGSA